MAKFVMLFRGGNVPTDKYEEHSKAWMNWFEQLGATGKLQEGGAPLAQDGKVAMADGSTKNYDWQTDSCVNGLCFVEVDTLDEAVALTAGCPAIDPSVGGTVEVRELSSM